MASWTGACAGRAAADCDARATTRASSVSPNAARTSEETSSMTTPARRAARVDRRVGWVGAGREALVRAEPRGRRAGRLPAPSEASPMRRPMASMPRERMRSRFRAMRASRSRSYAAPASASASESSEESDVGATSARGSDASTAGSASAADAREGGTFSLEEAPASAAGVPTFPADASAGVVRSRGLDSGGGDAGAGTLETIPARAHIRRSGPSGRFDIGPAPPRARGARAFEINTTTTCCAGTLFISLAQHGCAQKTPL